MIDRITIFTTVYGFIMKSLLWRYNPIEHKDETTTRRFTLQANDVYVEYFLDSQILMFTFNIPRLLYGDNIASAWAFNFETLSHRINEQLEGYIEYTAEDPMNGLVWRWPHYRYWKVSYIEYAIDFVLAKPYIDRYQDVIKKSAPSRRYLNDLYAEEGTIYYHSASKLHKSGVKECIYDKGDERLNATDTDYYNSPELTTLREWESILRLEIRLNRSAIRYRNQATHTTCKDGTISEVKVTNDPLFDTFEAAADYQRQTYIINKLIAQYGLDKPVATQSMLREIVQQHTPDIKTSKRNRQYRNRLYNAIEYFNGKRETINASDRTLRTYKNLFLDAGYHFVHSDIPLKPLTIETAQSRLPQHLKDSIETYKGSNIYRDYFFNALTNNTDTDDIMSTAVKPNIEVSSADNDNFDHKEPSTAAHRPTSGAESSDKCQSSSMCSRNCIGQIDAKHTPRAFLSCYFKAEDIKLSPFLENLVCICRDAL